MKTILVVISLCLVSLLGSPQIQAVQTSSQSTTELSLAQCKGPIRPLNVGDAIPNRISPEEVQCYRVSLDANNYMHAVVMQRGVDLILQLFRASGEKIGEPIDSPNGREGPEPVSEVARDKADYILAVKSQDPNATTPNYTITLEELRKANPEDNNYVTAERALIAGQLTFNAAQQLAANGQYADAVKKVEVAINTYGTALSALEAPQHTQFKIRVLKQLSQAYNTIRRPVEALKYLTQLRSLSASMPDPASEAAALMSMADAYMLMGEPAKAIEAYDAVKAIKNAPLDARALALGKLGDLKLSTNVVTAVDLYEESAKIYHSIPDPDREAEMLTWIGAKYFERSALLQAREHYEQSLRVANVKDISISANTWLNYAVTLGQAGEKQAALDAFRKSQDLYAEVEKISGQKDFVAQAYLLHGIGYLYATLDQHQIALDYYRRALEFSSPNHRLPDAEAFEHLYSGVSYYRLGENEKALAETNSALKIWEKLNDKRGQAMALVNAGQYFYDKGDKARALSYLEQALPLQQLAGDLYGQGYTLTNIAKIYSDLGRNEEALAKAKLALPIREKVSDRSGEVVTRYLIARIESASNNLKEAKLHLDRAIDQIEFLRTSIASHDLRASYFSTLLNVYLLDINVLMRLDKAFPNEGHAEEALKINESIRARNLLDALSTAKLDLGQGVEKDLIEKEKKLEHNLSLSLSRKILFENAKPTEQQRAELNREIETILEDLRNTSVEIQRVIPAYSALTDLKPVTAEKIRGLVDSETLLLEFALGDEISYLWLVSDQKVLSFDLPGRSQIEKIALEALNKITERNRSKVEKRIPVRIQRERDADKEYMQLSKQLSRILLGPVANQLASKRLVIVADGVLQYFPFSALPRPELPIGSDQWEPLILNHEVVVLPSASALSSIRETLSNRTPAPQLLAVITDPVYEPKPKKDQQNGARGTASARTGLALRQLDFAKRELRAIKESVRKVDPAAELKIWDRFEANLKNATSAELKMYRIIHYSAHGKLDGSRPESSGIVLALYDAGGKPVPDFFMGLRDVYHLRLFADLVVLSACESALGKEVKGEGIVGLTRGFMYAGSKRVVSSLWEVDEFQTSDLMALFYQNLLEGHMTVPSALQAAQVFMWQKRKLPPYYWAAFHMQGEWQGKLRP